jgi:ketosteroid isomerase-like protein
MPKLQRNSLSLVLSFKRSVALLIFALALPLWAMPPIPHKPNSNHHQIERLEESWRKAVLADDFDAMARLLADDYIAITASGTLQTKDQALAALRAGALHVTSMEVTDRKIRFYGKTAVVTSLSSIAGTNADGPVSGEYRYTRVYVRNPQGEWKIVSFEVSKIHPSWPQH